MKNWFLLFKAILIVFLTTTNLPLEIAAQKSEDCSAREFQAVRRFRTGELLDAAAVADFNRDGRADAAIVDAYSSNVSVMFGDGAANFGAARTVPVGLQPTAIVVGDFNNDNNPDFVTVNGGDGTLSLALGNGSGDFNAAPGMTLPGAPSDVTAADFNADGDLDLAVSFFDLNGVAVMLGSENNSPGYFLPPVVVRSVGVNPQAIVAADFNRDGRDDLAVANADSDSVTFLYGNGAGNFNRAKTYSTGDHPIALAAADFNRDGNTDLAVANQNSDDMTVFFGTAARVFWRATVDDIGENPRSLAAIDIRNDNRKALAVVSYRSETVTIVSPNQNGAFETARFDVAPGPIFAATGEFDSDGLPDLLVVNQAMRGFSVVLNNRAGGLKTAVSLKSHDSLVDLAIGDLNGDGHLDIATSNVLPHEHDVGGTMHVYLNDGAGAFGEHFEFLAGEVPGEITIGEFNGDFAADIALVDTTESRVRVYYNRGEMAFDRRALATGGTRPVSLKTADFNRDGKSDFIVANQNSNNVGFLRGNGDGTFAAAVSINVGARPASVEIGDFNRDGKLDAATANFQSNDVSILLGNGDGTFQTAANLPAGVAPSFVKTADINADGNPDLLVVNGSVGAPGVSVLRGNGDGTFQTAQTIAIGNLPNRLVAEDFSGDGKFDLAILDNDRSAVWLLRGDGAGNFSNAISYGVGLFPTGARSFDADMDGKPDLITANAGSGSLSILYNRCLP